MGVTEGGTRRVNELEHPLVNSAAVDPHVNGPGQILVTVVYKYGSLQHNEKFLFLALKNSDNFKIHLQHNNNNNNDKSRSEPGNAP